MFSNFSLHYLMKSKRSSIDESGFGFLRFTGTQASYFLFASTFPPIATKVSTCSSVHSSSFKDRTWHVFLYEISMQGPSE